MRAGCTSTNPPHLPGESIGELTEKACAEPRHPRPPGVCYCCAFVLFFSHTHVHTAAAMLLSLSTRQIKHTQLVYTFRNNIILDVVSIKDVDLQGGPGKWEISNKINVA